VNVRREANAAKSIVTRDDLARFGDNNLTDALKRVPGITVDRPPGQDAVIRLRGLGNGYTQILVNGDPVQQGFSIDSISPAQIERIEVLRTATADMSNQAIAGTVNIVLKQARNAHKREFKVGIREYGDRLSPTISGDYADHDGALAYGLGVNASVDRDLWPAVSMTQTADRNGAPTSAYHTYSIEEQRERKLSLTPRATWKPSDTQSLSFNGLLEARQRDFEAPDSRRGEFGEKPLFANNILVTGEHATQARAATQWKSLVGKDGSVEAKLTLNLLHRRADSYFNASSENLSPILYRTIQSNLKDHSVAFSGKYALGLNAKHALDIGWDGERGRRAENRDQSETSPVDFPTENLAEDYIGIVSRLAVFAQDAWTISDRLSGYLGVRHEVLTTKTRGNVLATVNSRSSVLSPTAQVVWKIPGSTSDQLRLALARTFKAPTARELIPRRWVVNQNSATTPNFQGNPDLLPELAWGLDVGYERYLSEGAFLGVNAYGRRISRVVLSHVFRSGNTWVEEPRNSGDAEVVGLELEAKGKLKQIVDSAANVDLHAGISRNWSRLNSVPGPDNRLNRQPWLTASLGADWRLAELPLTIGSNFVFEAGGYTRLTRAQSIDVSNKRLLDMYVLLAIDKTSSLRLSATNLLAEDDAQQARFFDDSINQTWNNRNSTFRALKLVYESKH